MLEMRVVSGILSSPANGRRPHSARPHSARPQLESLEERAVPAAIVTWGGNALFSNKWTNGANWIS